MSKYSTVKAREQFSEVLNKSAYGKERVVLTRRGRDLVAVVPIEDMHLLEKLEDRFDLEEARKALKDVENNGTIPWETIKKERRR